MLLTVDVQKKRSLIRNCKYHNFKWDGYLRHQLNKDAVVLEEQDQAIVIDFIQQLFSLKWINIVIQKL